jgi:hypothetical protein
MKQTVQFPVHTLVRIRRLDGRLETGIVMPSIPIPGWVLVRFGALKERMVACHKLRIANSDEEA